MSSPISNTSEIGEPCPEDVVDLDPFLALARDLADAAGEVDPALFPPAPRGRRQARSVAR